MKALTPADRSPRGTDMDYPEDNITYRPSIEDISARIWANRDKWNKIENDLDIDKPPKRNVIVGRLVRCLYCGKFFVARRKNATYCPLPAICREEAKKERSKRTWKM